MGRRTRDSTSDREGDPVAATPTDATGPERADATPPVGEDDATEPAHDEPAHDEPAHDDAVTSVDAAAGARAEPTRAEPAAEEPAAKREGPVPNRRRTGRRASRLRNWRRTKAWKLVATTVRACMRYRVTGLAAEAAYFGLLSLPPLVFGMAGTIGYAVGIFGDQTVDSVKVQIIDLTRSALTESSVQGVIVPTLNAVFGQGRADVVSIGFVLALWSGSRALNVFIDTVSIMYGMGGKRGIVKTRALSFSVYTVALFIGVTVLPLVLAGPELVRDALPDRLGAVAGLYWPVVVTLSMLLMTSVYHFAVPVRYPWRYGLPGAVLVFSIWILGSLVLRLVLSASIGGQSTSIYGPLAAPIVVMIWLYIIAIAVLIGAALNSATAAVWPVTSADGDEEGSPVAAAVGTDGDPGSADLDDESADDRADHDGGARTDAAEPAEPERGASA